MQELIAMYDLLIAVFGVSPFLFLIAHRYTEDSFSSFLITVLCASVVGAMGLVDYIGVFGYASFSLAFPLTAYYLYTQDSFFSFLITILCTSVIFLLDVEFFGYASFFLVFPLTVYSFYCYCWAKKERQVVPKTLDKGTSTKNIAQQMLPGVELLTPPKQQRSTATDRRNELITVLKNFGISGKILGIQTGPAVTLYEFEPSAGLKISKIVVLADDIARAMSAMSVRIAKILGKSFIGIEISNPVQEIVYLKDIVERSSDYELPVGLGKSISGEPVTEDLTKMPHLLVAGTTGSGKSVAVHSMLLSLFYKVSYTKLRLLLIDPKMLEFAVYKDIPHLIHPVVTDPKDAVTALKWVVREMERRYQEMSKIGVRNIIGYNQQVDKPMPYIVVIVDEMADLMVVAGKEIEIVVQRLAQMARASGIHIIMATQRPSVDVITGTIKANFPSRISFQVSSKIDSRTIIGEQGAEQLLGRGDMLYFSSGGKLTRVHGSFSTEDEAEAVSDFLRSLSPPDYIAEVTKEIEEEVEITPSSDARYVEAVDLVRRSNKASATFLVTNMGLGHSRASRIIQQMEKEGIISEAHGPKHLREVLR